MFYLQKSNFNQVFYLGLGLNNIKNIWKKPVKKGMSKRQAVVHKYERYLVIW